MVGERGILAIQCHWPDGVFLLSVQPVQTAIVPLNVYFCKRSNPAGGVFRGQRLSKDQRPTDARGGVRKALGDREQVGIWWNCVECPGLGVAALTNANAGAPCARGV